MSRMHRLPAGVTVPALCSDTVLTLPWHCVDGKVTVVSHDFIALLVLGLFNVAIGRQQIRADLSYDGEVNFFRSPCFDAPQFKHSLIVCAMSALVYQCAVISNSK